MSVVLAIVGFVASFWMLGPIGFRYGVLRSSANGASGAPVAPVFRATASKAGVVGILGAGLGVVSLVTGLLEHADQKHISFADAFGAGGAATVLQAASLAVLLIAFVLAWRNVHFAWPIAAVAGIAFALRTLVNGKLAGMVNPIHVLGASLWIGTLFVLVVCGIAPFIAAPLSSDDREPAVAQMVHRFSLVALLSAGALGATGVITAWTHLKRLDALWTTTYGQVLLAKLAVVAVVFGLGAWNWRRVGPALGKEGGARKIRRTAASELAVAAVVLVLTGVLVSTPSPKPQRAAPASDVSHPE